MQLQAVLSFYLSIILTTSVSSGVWCFRFRWSLLLLHFRLSSRLWLYLSVTRRVFICIIVNSSSLQCRHLYGVPYQLSIHRIYQSDLVSTSPEAPTSPDEGSRCNFPTIPKQQPTRRLVLLPHRSNQLATKENNLGNVYTTSGRRQSARVLDKM
jgi:hypothetical protein